MRMRDVSADALHDAEDVGVGAPGGHEIDEADGPLGGLEGGFENQRVVAIAACGLKLSLRRSDLPVAVFLGAEQRGKAGIGREVRPAEPVNGAIAVDERSSLAIADESIILDLCSHILLVARS